MCCVEVYHDMNEMDHATCACQSGIVAFMHIMDPNVFLINVFLDVCMMLILNNAYIKESRDLLNIDESFHMFEKLTATVRMAVCNASSRQYPSSIVAV